MKGEIVCADCHERRVRAMRRILSDPDWCERTLFQAGFARRGASGWGDCRGHDDAAPSAPFSKRFAAIGADLALDNCDALEEP